VPVTIAARRIITRADREPIEHGAVRVTAGGVVDAVGRAADFSAIDIDLGDLTLIPGMIDAHVHLSSDCSPAMGWLPGEEHPEAAAVLRIVSNAHAFLRAGVTTVRDLGTEKGLAGLVRDSAVRDGGAPVPIARILAAATHRAADAIGLADQAGEIAPGRPADLAGLDGDPLADPGAYRRVGFVMRGGQRCY
jgi:imidazolonepropionase-like amidohydrolase